MIISTPIRAVAGRGDIVTWALTSRSSLSDVTGVTRCIMICNKDDQQSVIIDSNTVSAAFDFTVRGAVNGRRVQELRWKPGVAINDLFPVAGIWKADVYLYDAVHTNGVLYGEFELEVMTITGGSDVFPPYYIQFLAGHDPTIGDELVQGLFASSGSDVNPFGTVLSSNYPNVAVIDSIFTQPAGVSFPPFTWYITLELLNSASIPFSSLTLPDSTVLSLSSATDSDPPNGIYIWGRMVDDFVDGNTYIVEINP